MKPQSKTILRDALSLPESDRAEIAGALLESLEPSPDTDVEEAWRKEVARRVGEIESGSVQSVSWEEVRDRLYSRLDARRTS